MPHTQMQKRLEELAARLEIVTVALLCDGDAKRSVLMAERRVLLAESLRVEKALHRLDAESAARPSLELVASQAAKP